jgi:hypothetical protein
MKNPCVLAAALLFGFASELRAQSDSLVDVFPLAVGNQWTYRYYTLTEIWPAGTPLETRTDSGLATYRVVGSVREADSTRWEMRLMRNLTRHQIFWHFGGGFHDTTFAIRDSSFFDLVENHQRQHQLYQNTDPNLIRLEIFPFTRGYVDTTMIFRYRRVGAGDTIAFRSWILPTPSPLFRSTFTFQRGVGLTRNRYHSGTVDVYALNEHHLVNSIITSAPVRLSDHASGFMLSQNYPNPFNPTTRIAYAIPKTSHVSLKVFDVLGREVATLVDAVQDAGFKSVEFNAADLASGVYFYRLISQGFVETKKLLLVQ